MKIAIGNDHAAVELKNIIKEHLILKVVLRVNMIGSRKMENIKYLIYQE